MLQLHKTVLASLEVGAGKHTGNYLKRVVPMLYYHPKLHELTAGGNRDMMQQCWDTLCRAFATASQEQKENGSIVACLLFDLLADQHRDSNAITFWDMAYSLVDEQAHNLRKRDRRLVV